MMNENYSEYFVYYCTVKGDVLGWLIITNNEILFDPFNIQFKGYINPINDDFFSNKKLQMSISYNELLDV